MDERRTKLRLTGSDSSPSLPPSPSHFGLTLKTFFNLSSKSVYCNVDCSWPFLSFNAVHSAKNLMKKELFSE